MIALRAEPKNACDSMRFSRESFSNEINKSDSQIKKHDEQRISTFRGIVIDVLGWQSKERRPMFATRTLAARERKKADDETMTSFLDANPITVADLVARQTLMRAMMTEALDILMKRD
jgi:hypothetical protein